MINSTRSRISIVILLVLVLGIFFRFVNLDGMIYWVDEAATSLRISGYTEQEVKQNVFNGQIIGIEALQKYQHLNEEKKLTDTIKSLALEEPQLSPLYYVILRIWTQCLGDSILVTRSLSAVISLLVFPCLYWLCIELFEHRLVGWLAMALVSISPFHLLYAQEARLYSLFTVTTLLSSAALLQSIRLNTRLNWGLYSAALSLGFYTTPLTGLVAIGHSIYFTVSRGIRESKILRNFFLSLLVGLLTFMPWLIILVINLNAAHNQTRWLSDYKVSFFVSLGSYLINIVRVFLDVPSKILWKATPDTYQISDIFLGLFSLPLLALVVFSICFICRNSQKKAWLFVLTLIGTTSVIFLLSDLIFGGVRIIYPRYQIPVILGIQLAVSYLLSNKSSLISSQIHHAKYWKIIIFGLILSGVMSCTIISQSELWWNKYFNISNLSIAKIVNQSEYPLIISDANSTMHLLNILSMSHNIESKAKILLFPPAADSLITIPEIPDSYSDVFLLNPSKILLRSVSEDQNFILVYDGRKFNPYISLYKLVQ